MIQRTITTLILVLAAVLGASAFKADTLTVASERIPAPMKVTVILPDIAANSRNLPVVYMLNGYGGGYRDWGKIRPNIGEYADRYGMVFVMPSGMDSWYWDAPANPKMQMESFFVKDLVPHIDSVLPVSRDRRLRAITGLSMGGHGAYWLGMRHPDIWGNIGSMSGGVDIRPFEGRWKMAAALGPKEGNGQVWDDHTVITHVDLLKKNGQNLTFDCGVDDFFHQVNENFHKELVKAGVPHDYTSRPGKHNWDYWRNSILYHLLFFHENFVKAQKNAATK